MAKLMTCVEMPVEENLLQLSLLNAYLEREENVLNEETIGEADSHAKQLLIEAFDNKDWNKYLNSNFGSKEKLIELALEKGKLWRNGKTLRVKFLGGNQYLKSKIQEYVKMWEKFANIKFNFISNGNAEIRISFIEDNGHWSYVGTDALNILDQTRPTMNFGFAENTPESILGGTILHEFGHALGCIHEHQSPAAGINWNRQVVYDYHSQEYDWDKKMVDDNILSVYSQKEITNSEFDRNSIMIYPIPREFTTDGFSVEWNNLISIRDAQFIAECYPRN